jgi:hypothetical protein
MATIVSPELIQALKMTESSNNPNVKDGDGGKAKGILQIWPIMVEDCNRIYKTKYVHNDVYNVSIAEDICRKILTHYGDYYTKKYKKPATDDILARIWNGGGSGYLNPATLKYWDKVQGFLKKKEL